MDQVLKIENRDGIVVLTIQRPKALNAINDAVMKGLHDWFSKGYASIDCLKGVIITGSGDKAFVAGADIKEFSALDVEGGMAKSKFGHDTYFLIERFHVPVIAAINGFALGGGCELAMACHMRMATEQSKFGQPEVNLGLVPGYGGTQRLVQLIGKGRALELLLTADMIDAATALRYGLVNQLVEESLLIDHCIKCIEKIATKGPQSVRETIRLVNCYFDKDVDGFEAEYRTFGRLLNGEECKEGVQAFVEKRKADFKR